MSAPSIPNLFSLRGSRGASRGRGRGRGGHPQSAALSHDTTIQGTDTDAAVSRMSAVDLGYLQDPYAQYFVQNAAAGGLVRRLPIINRGKKFEGPLSALASAKARGRDLYSDYCVG